METTGPKGGLNLGREQALGQAQMPIRIVP
jgi:hypothetical protein